ncbi:MAG: carbamoyltransferase HypF [Bacteroidales bacterium]|nr:carbamoyltransferase HypF [Bacteroidales bacterium]
MINTYQIEVTGLVQGVGFRPFIYRIAQHRGLKGIVRNTNRNVIIEVNADEITIHEFISTIKNEAPLAASIKSIDFSIKETTNFAEFSIVKSESTSYFITEVSPDISVCPECLEDMKVQENRIHYPFINCTNCGPRFSIIKELPYDRKNTTMGVFEMCDDCMIEYTNIYDRRFHAQPVACSICGPHYELEINGKTISDIDEIVSEVHKLIDNGKVIAIKGIGGYFISCDALNEAAVQKLRSGKKRYGKPFAVMFRDIEAIKQFAKVNDEEAKLLISWRKPIVLLNLSTSLAQSVTMGFSTIGAMLPYMPLHNLLFEKLKTPAIVLTSGNLSEEPICIFNKEARQKLGPITDALISYNREVHNRVDDSVTMIANKKEHIIRRSRGYAPSPIDLKLNTEGILATGAELVNCFCIGKGNQALLSQHIGDLKNFETYEFFIESIDRYKNLFRFTPQLIACDMHPDYLSTRYAKESGIPYTEIQHHHAHIAACMAEYGLDEKVIGFSFDGTGLGTDGAIWGGEVLLCDLNTFERPLQFEYFPLPGGDKAVEEPWRMAVSYLYSIYKENFFSLNLPFMQNVDEKMVTLILQAIDKKINSPLTSSCGRLFDAVAAMTGACSASQFHAEAPMRLESLIKPDCDESYEVEISGSIKTSKIIKQIVDDIHASQHPSQIATKFHNTIINSIFASAKQIADTTGIKKVVLSGGTFQNRYLIEKAEEGLKKRKFEVFIPCQVPANDGGIALGQMAIAAKRRELQCV